MAPTMPPMQMHGQQEIATALVHASSGETSGGCMGTGATLLLFLCILAIGYLVWKTICCILFMMVNGTRELFMLQ